MINEKLFRRLRKAFEYLEKYDELGNYPDKKVPVSISLSLELKHKLSKISNLSKYVESLIKKDLARKERFE